MMDARLALLFCAVVVGCGGTSPSDGVGVGGNASRGVGGASGASGAASQAGMGGCVYGGVSYAAGDIIPLSTCDSCRCYGNGATNCARTLLVIAPTCVYANGIWTEGTVVPATDNCNSCSCETESTGLCARTTAMSCTALDCAGSCAYAGRFYATGESFPATDGCNRCTCSNGVVDCTKNDCSCNTQQYWRLYRFTDASQCAAATLDCPVGTTEFTNACGCGCEQSPECPQYAQCVPMAAEDAGANPAAIPTLPPPCTLPTVCPLSVANAIIL